MKIEIVFKDGRKETVESVASFTVMEEDYKESNAIEARPEANQSNQTEARPEANQPTAREVAQTPTEGKLFEINPLGMDRSIFKRKRKDKKQEWTRKIINEAFAEVDKRTKEYGESFYTLIPEKAWDGGKTVDELKQYAKDLGGQMADWIQQALEWAQRICNGESWQKVSNDADTAKCYRMIIWKDGSCRIVGGSHGNWNALSATDVFGIDCRLYTHFEITVPLVVIKKTA